MGLSVDFKRMPPLHGFVRYARSFYELLGNRRKFARTSIAGPIVVTYSGSVIETMLTCSLRDLSLRGLGIESPDAMKIGAFIRVRSDENGPKRLARVCYCYLRGTSYWIGLELVG